jgi:hypothetical protein
LNAFCRGLELVSLPNILFLDEPTSGLDATASLEIIESLEKLAKAGMTIVSVIHQPRFSLFTKFDNVILMGKGTPVYAGSTSEVLDYFQNYLQIPCPESENPADFFLDTLTEHDDLDKWWKEYTRSYKGKSDDAYQEGNSNIYLPQKDLPNAFQQFFVQFIRSFRQLLYGTRDFAIEILLTMIGGFSSGFIIGPKWTLPQFLTLSSLTGLGMAFVSLSTSLNILSKDRLVFWRESQSGVSVSGFFYAKMILQLRQVIILPFLYSYLVHALINPDVNLFAWYGIFLCLAWNASGIGLICSVALESAALLATIVIALVLGGFLAGVYPALKDLQGGAKLLANISFNRWSGEAMMILESQGLPNYYTTTPLFFNGYDRNGLAFDFATLIILGFIYRIVTLIVLRFKRRNFNWIQWLLELRDWIFVPSVVIMGLISGVIALLNLTSIYLAISFFQLGVIGYLIYALNVHYCCLDMRRKKKKISPHPSLTLLQMNLCVDNVFWVIFQLIGDLLLLGFSLIWIFFDAGTRSSALYLACVSSVIKSFGYLALLRKRLTERGNSRAKLLSAYSYPILFLLSSGSLILLSLDLGANSKLYPPVLCALPLFILLLKSVWNILGDMTYFVKIIGILPAVLSYFLAILQIDLNVDFSSYFIVFPLIIYPAAYIGQIARMLLFFFYALGVLCIQGFTMRSISKILSALR